MTGAMGGAALGCAGGAPRVDAVGAGDRARVAGDHRAAAIEYRRALDEDIPADHPEHARVRGLLQGAVQAWMRTRASELGGLTDPSLQLEALVKAWNTALALSPVATRDGDFGALWSQRIGAEIAALRTRADAEPHAALARAQWLAASAQHDAEADRVRAELGERVRVLHETAADRTTGAVRAVHRLGAMVRTSHELPKAELEVLQGSLAIAQEVRAAGAGPCADDASTAAAAASSPPSAARSRSASLTVQFTSCTPRERRWTAEETYSYTVKVKKPVSRQVADGQECEAPRMVASVSTTCSSYGSIGQNTYCAGWTQTSSVSSVPGACKPRYRWVTEAVEVDDTRSGTRTTEFLERAYDVEGTVVVRIDGKTTSVPFKRATVELDRAFTEPRPQAHTLTSASVRAKSAAEVGAWLRDLTGPAQLLVVSSLVERARATGDEQAYAEAALRGASEAAEWSTRTVGLSPSELTALLAGNRPGGIQGLTATEPLPERKLAGTRGARGPVYARAFYQGVNARLLSGSELALTGTALGAGGGGWDLGFEYRIVGERVGSYGPRVRLGLASVGGDVTTFDLAYRFYLGDTKRARQRFVLGTGLTVYEQRGVGGETTFRNAGMPLGLYVRATDLFSLDGGVGLNAFKLLDLVNLSDSDTVSHGWPMFVGASLYVGTRLRLYGRSEIVVLPYRDPWHSIGAAVRW